MEMEFLSVLLYSIRNSSSTRTSFFRQGVFPLPVLIEPSCSEAPRASCCRLFLILGSRATSTTQRRDLDEQPRVRVGGKAKRTI